MPTREEQKEIRRNEIIAAALDLFIRKGYGGTRITDIAKAVNMSTGLLFHYFESKEQLYETLVQYGLSGPQTVMDIDNSDPLVFFRSVTESILFYIKTNPILAKIFIFMGQVSLQEPATDNMQRIAEKITNIQDSVPIIVKGQEMGQIREGDPLALSLMFWGAIQGVAQSCAMDAALPIPETEWFLDILKKQ